MRGEKQYNLKMYCKLTPVIGLYYVHYKNKFWLSEQSRMYADYWGDTIPLLWNVLHQSNLVSRRIFDELDNLYPVIRSWEF